MDSWQGSQLNTAKEILAYELTKLVHGEEEAQKAQEGARALFSGAGNTENMPTFALTDDDFTDDEILVSEIMIKAGLISSKGEGRRLIEQGGHECNQPEPPICKCGKMKRMCLGSNADKHGREGRREQRRERLQCSMREWFKLWTEQRVEAKPESAEAKAQQKGDGITHGLTGWPSGPEYGPGWCRSSRQGGRLRYRSALSCVRQMPPDPSNRRRGRRPS